jgi:hypothetical protein
MNSERATAYRRVMKTLSDLGPAKLLADEQDRIRAAADTLIFSSDPFHDAAAQEAMGDIDGLCRALIESGRWQEATALRLADDIADCGLAHVPTARAA